MSSVSYLPRPASRLPDFGGRRLVGRGSELARIAELSADDDARLVTLVGPPGVGKTRLALEVAREAERSPPLSTLWIAAATHHEVDDLVATVAGSLGVAAAGALPVAAQVGAVLAGQGPVLLIVDDADRIAPHLGALLDGWLEAAPELRVMVTSRARLGASSEQILEIGPLPLEDAVILFEARARAARRDAHAALPSDVSQELARRLDCLPLALELAAARTSALPPRKLLERLDRNVGELLRATASGSDPRHASLAAAIETSWQLLGPDELATLQQCAAFAESFSLEGAEAVVLGIDGSVTDTLTALTDRSLLQRYEPPSLDGEIRFALYASVRAFARGRFDEGEALRAVEERVDAFLIAECGRLAKSLEGPGAREAEERLELEREQLVATHRRGLERSPSIAVAAGLVLAELSALRGLSGTGIHEETVRAARATGDASSIARALVAFAGAAGRLGYVDEPRRALDEAVAIAGSEELRVERARALLARGRYHAQHGAFDEADADLERGLAVERDIDDPWLAGSLRNVVGCVAEIRGAFPTAVAAFEAAKTSFRRAGSERMEAAVHNNLGVARQAEGRREDSRELFESALALATASHNRVIEADAHMNLGSWYLGEGDLDGADRHSRLGLALQRRLGNRRFEGLSLMNLAMAAHERGDLREARHRYQQALSTLRECGETRFVAMSLPFAAAAEASLGLLAEARADFEAARHPPPGMDPGFEVVVDTLESFLFLAETRGASAEDRAGAERLAAERYGRARGRLERDVGAARRPELAQATRLLARVFGPGETATTAGADRRPSERPAEDARSSLSVGVGERWFRLDEGPSVDLSKRSNLRLVLRALIEHRQDAPGAGLNAERLFEAGWPDQKAQPQAAAARVYTAMNTLRRLGLDAVLRRHDDGYLIDPITAITRSSR